jgi:quercetin dioxygenase-like cupin family protein/DNA-binding Xre family transcriptional regulator
MNAERSPSTHSVSDNDSTGSVRARPGAVLRALREQRGWTLAEVSERTGLAVSTLSKVENDKMSLTYDKLSRLSKGLAIDIGLLFSAAATASAADAVAAAPVTRAFWGRRSVSHSGQGSAIDTPNYSHVYPATELLNKQMVPIFGQPKARTLEEFGELLRHSGEEFSVVLDGAVVFHTELYAPVLLNKGDSVYFDSSMGHAYLRASDEPCHVLTVCSDGASLAAAGYPPLAPADSLTPTPAVSPALSRAEPAVRRANGHDPAPRAQPSPKPRKRTPPRR